MQGNKHKPLILQDYLTFYSGGCADNLTISQLKKVSLSLSLKHAQSVNHDLKDSNILIYQHHLFETDPLNSWFRTAGQLFQGQIYKKLLLFANYFNSNFSCSQSHMCTCYTLISLCLCSHACTHTQMHVCVCVYNFLGFAQCILPEIGGYNRGSEISTHDPTYQNHHKY